MNPIIECVPNFSEGRNPSTIEKITAVFSHSKGVRLLDIQTDKDHNRMVVTVLGEPQAVKTAVLKAMDKAIALIDMRHHQGQHPCMGAVDVVPFIPIHGMNMADAIAIAKELADEAAVGFDLPIFLYERAATAPHRTNLAAVRKGEFEGMTEKLKDPMWKPDFGPARVHPTAGVTAVGARAPLVAFNVNLGTSDMGVAGTIARKVRHINGGLRYCKAMAVSLNERNIVQVSMNMTDFSQTALYQVLELIRIEARRYGVPVVGSEVVGLVPMQALIDTAAYYLGLENFSPQQVLEHHLMSGNP